jgi:hypothetical protein
MLGRLTAKASSNTSPVLRASSLHAPLTMPPDGAGPATKKYLNIELLKDQQMRGATTA